MDDIPSTPPEEQSVRPLVVSSSANLKLGSGQKALVQITDMTIKLCRSGRPAVESYADFIANDKAGLQLHIHTRFRSSKLDAHFLQKALPSFVETQACQDLNPEVNISDNDKFGETCLELLKSLNEISERKRVHD